MGLSFLGFGVSDLGGFRVRGSLELRVAGFRGLGFRVQGLGV